MKQFISAVSIIVPDYDQAIAFYTGKLGFRLIDNIDMGSKRWVTVQPPGSLETQLVLARAGDEQQANAIGNQGAGRVWLFLQTDDFYRDYRLMQNKGVTFLEEPREEAYGTVAVFQDDFGNKWDLIERRIENI